MFLVKVYVNSFQKNLDLDFAGFEERHQHNDTQNTKGSKENCQARLLPRDSENRPLHTQRPREVSFDGFHPSRPLQDKT